MGQRWLTNLRKVGGEIKAAAEKELTDLYPKDRDGATPIAYLWARTVRCESPDCGAEIPLMRSFWLCKKPKRKWALRVKVVRPTKRPPRVDFEIFEPEADREVRGGTVARREGDLPVLQRSTAAGAGAGAACGPTGWRGHGVRRRGPADGRGADDRGGDATA